MQERPGRKARGSAASNTKKRDPVLSSPGRQPSAALGRGAFVTLWACQSGSQARWDEFVSLRGWEMGETAAGNV